MNRLKLYFYRAIHKILKPIKSQLVQLCLKMAGDSKDTCKIAVNKRSGLYTIIHILSYAINQINCKLAHFIIFKYLKMLTTLEKLELEFSSEDKGE